MNKFKEWLVDKYQNIKAKADAFNLWLAYKLSGCLCTMAMFYGIAFLVTIPLRWQTPEGMLGWSTWFVQAFFQGVALPVLGLVGKLSGDKLEKLVLETHDVAMESHDELHSKLDAIIEKLEVTHE